MYMKVASLDLGVGTLKRRLVDAHAVRELRLEEIIISPCDFRNSLCKLLPFIAVEVHQRPLVFPTEYHDLERPSGPPRADCQERLILEDYPLFSL